jgi:hypothetical protein
LSNISALETPALTFFPYILEKIQFSWFHKLCMLLKDKNDHQKVLLSKKLRTLNATSNFSMKIFGVFVTLSMNLHAQSRSQAQKLRLLLQKNVVSPPTPAPQHHSTGGQRYILL